MIEVKHHRDWDRGGRESRRDRATMNHVRDCDRSCMIQTDEVKWFL